MSRKLFDRIEPATPAQDAQRDASTCWADEKHLVMHADAATPDRCVRCNAPANGFRLSRTFKEPSRTAGGETIHVSARQSATVSLALCPRHIERRHAFTRLGWGLAIGGLVLFAVSILLIGLGLEAHGNALLAAVVVLLIGLVGLIAGMSLAGHAGSVLTVHRIDGQRLWLTRAGTSFLAALPKLPEDGAIANN